MINHAETIPLIISANFAGPCENNGGCSQLCVINPGGQTCMCQAGMTINEDKRTCKICTVYLTYMYSTHLVWWIIFTKDEVKIVGYWSIAFSSALLWTNAGSGSIMTQKIREKEINKANIQPSWPNKLAGQGGKSWVAKIGPFFQLGWPIRKQDSLQTQPFSKQDNIIKYCFQLW